MDLLQVSEEDKSEIYQQINTTKEKILIDVGILKNWYKQQLHLPQDHFDERIVTNLLLRNKSSIEKTKQRIDYYYSMKIPHKRFFKDLENFVPSKHLSYYLPLPVLTPDKCRVIITYLRDTNPDNYNLLLYQKSVICFNEILLREDQVHSMIPIFDFTGCTLEHMKKFDASVITDVISIVLVGFSWRIRSVHFINVPSFFHIIMGVVKKIVKAKLVERFCTHENLESLHEAIPPNLLPVEFGGTHSSVSELIDKWDKVFDERRDVLRHTLTQVSDETKRVGKSKFDIGYGVDGTFKKLDID